MYTHPDVLGVELGGSLKNVMAVATGISDGLGLGANSRAALVTRGLGGDDAAGRRARRARVTFAGLAGLGDLGADLHRGAESKPCCRRGRRAGPDPSGGACGIGESVAEGVVTARSALALAERTGVEMPIVRAVNRVLFEARPARQAIGDLMERELRAESD